MESVDSLVHSPVAIRGVGYRYPAVVGAGLLDHVGEYTRKYLPRERCTIISDGTVAPLFADRVKKSLITADFRPTLITVPTGEKSKTLEKAGAICDQMVAAGLDRKSFVIGLGGGVIGDISGFVAAIYHRGIPHVQIPTTLLAMVDSSIGGKTGVNAPHGKNLIGAFHHPSLEFNQGFAEIIKHAVIADAKMFGTLQDWKAADAAALQRLIRRNIQIKRKIVARDMRDQTGERAVLNFGHTVGHAIERAGEYRKFLHGEALSLGIVAACAISTNKAWLSADQRDAIVDLLEKFKLPIKLPKNFPRQKIVEALKFDKKFEGGKVRFVVTPRIGAAHLTNDVTLDDIRAAIAQL